MNLRAFALALTALSALVVSPAGGFAPEADAQPDPPGTAGCNEPACVPGITAGAVLGAPCRDTAYYVFGTTFWGRLVFCGSPRRYEPRYFRSPALAGVRAEHSGCTGFDNQVAQAPDGLFLFCEFANGEGRWVRGDT